MSVMFSASSNIQRGRHVAFLHIQILTELSFFSFFIFNFVTSFLILQYVCHYTFSLESIAIIFSSSPLRIHSLNSSSIHGALSDLTVHFMNGTWSATERNYSVKSLRAFSTSFKASTWVHSAFSISLIKFSSQNILYDLFWTTLSEFFLQTPEGQIPLWNITHYYL